MNPPAHSRLNVSRATPARPGIAACQRRGADTGRPQAEEEEGPALPSAPAAAAPGPGAGTKFPLLAGRTKWESRGFPRAVPWHGASSAGEERGGRAAPSTSEASGPSRPCFPAGSREERGQFRKSSRDGSFCLGRGTQGRAGRAVPAYRAAGSEVGSQPPRGGPRTGSPPPPSAQHSGPVQGTGSGPIPPHRGISSAIPARASRCLPGYPARARIRRGVGALCREVSHRRHCHLRCAGGRRTRGGRPRGPVSGRCAAHRVLGRTSPRNSPCHKLRVSFARTRDETEIPWICSGDGVPEQ